MFIDYYAILNLRVDADQSKVKSAYKDQALKWHPDKNPGTDTTQRMQLINEAYLILKDVEARQRYDIEYRIYKNQQNNTKKDTKKEKQTEQTNQDVKFDSAFEDTSYEIFDETLKKWMSNARSQAVNLAKQTIEDIKGMSKVGGQAIAEAAIGGIVKYIFLGFMMLFLLKACQR
jgi:curved DNA-binding protein CbpA